MFVMQKSTDEKCKIETAEIATEDKGKANKKRCFVIMPFSETEDYVQGHFMRVYDYLIKPACEEAGFEALRGDSNPKADFIPMEIVKQIVECDMAICDLSARNPNVFYELGLRHAFDLKTVLIKDEKTERAFDTSGIRTIEYNSSLRIDEVEKSIEEIVKSIKNTYEQKEKDGNSLIQLLSVKGPAQLPESRELNQDTSIILNEIRDLRFEMQQLRSRGITSSRPMRFFRLPNGEMVTANTKLYVKGDLPQFEEYGEFIGINPNGYDIRTSNGMIIQLPHNAEIWNTLTFKASSSE